MGRLLGVVFVTFALISCSSAPEPEPEGAPAPAEPAAVEPAANPSPAEPEAVVDGGGAPDAGVDTDAGPPEPSPTPAEPAPVPSEPDPIPPATCDGVAVSDPCLAVACENAEGIGRPCTAGGNECDDLGFGVLCSADFSDDPPLAFCTKPCFFGNASNCGGGDMVCEGDPDDPLSGSGCVPQACASE